jgi:hypothetical protein
MSGAGEQEGEAEFLPSFPTVESFSQAALRQTILCTKHSGQLPGEKDWDYYSTFPGFRRSVPCTWCCTMHPDPGARYAPNCPLSVMAAQQSRVRAILRDQLEYNGIRSRVAATEPAELLDLLSDANDTLLERVHLRSGETH